MVVVVRAILVRVMSAALVVWASVTLLFGVFHVLPGSGADAVLAGDRIASPEEVQRTSERLGLDKPLHVQYWRYWKALSHGDLGTSFTKDRPVASLLSEAAPASLRLAFWALLLEVFIGIGVAVLVFRRRWLRDVATALSVFAIAVPVFVFGYLLQFVLGVYPAQHQWPSWASLPVQGIGDDTWWLVFPTGSQWRHLVLPAFTLAVVSSAVLLRLTLSGLRGAAVAPHVDGARARGVPERIVFRRHVLRNALIPLLTFVGADLVALFGSAVLTESVFNWPGIGSVVSGAMTRQDVPVVLGTAVVLALAYVAINTLVDVLYRVVDPRLR